MFWSFLKQRKRRNQAFIDQSVYVVPGKIRRKTCKTIFKHPEKSQHWFPTHSYVDQNESHQRLSGLADKRNHRYLDGLQGLLQYLTCCSHKKITLGNTVQIKPESTYKSSGKCYFGIRQSFSDKYEELYIDFSFMVCLPLQPSLAIKVFTQVFFWQSSKQ